MTRGMFRRFGIPRPDEATRKAAVEATGATWKEWFYFEFLKVWAGLGFFIVDVWIAASFLQPFQPLPMAVGLGVGLYLEFLAFRYLWRRPDPVELSRPQTFKRTWYRPTSVGRWTPERFRMIAGLDPDPEGLGRPDPNEFL
ncbi:MAG: hypothetical protein ACHQ2Y_03160 [Candidatus Lutacidiplasmatales archaeon]